MTATGLHIDGNGVAGSLGEIFAVEMTTVERICQTCRCRSAIGAHRAYQGAGIALRCPNCGDLGAVVGLREERGYVFELRGTWMVSHSA